MTTLRKALASFVGAFFIILASSVPVLAAPTASGMVTIPIPEANPGLYINLVTGETSTTNTEPDGWDVKIDQRLQFRVNDNVPRRMRSGQVGVVSRLTRHVGGAYNLPLGFEVGPNIPYLNGLDPTDASKQPEFTQQYNWSFPGDANYVGVRFWNEATDAYHYGWMRICVSENKNALPKALVEYGYESTPDTPIQVGAGGDASPSDCGASTMTELVRPFCTQAHAIRSDIIDSLVFEAKPGCTKLKFIDDVQPPPTYDRADVDYLNPDRRQAPWENTTMQGPAGSPVNVEFEGYSIQTESKDKFSLKIRTLTLKDVNLSPSGFDFTFRGDTTAISLENASISWSFSPGWIWSASEPLTLTASGDSQLKGMIGQVPPPTTLTVGNGTTLRCEQCGSTDTNRPDTSRLYFSNKNNQADIDGGTFELRNSYMIWGENIGIGPGSKMRVHNGGRLFLAGSGTVLRTDGSLTADSGGVIELDYVAVLDIVGNTLNLDDGSIVVAQQGQIRTHGLLVNGSSTVTLGTGANVNVNSLVLVADGETLTLDGRGAGAILKTRLLELENGSLVRLTGESVMAIGTVSNGQTWDEGSSIEIGPNSTLALLKGARVTSKIPIDVDGTVRVEGIFVPTSDLEGDGLLQVLSGGYIVKSSPVTINPSIKMDPESNLYLTIDPTAGQSGKLIANSAFQNDGAYLVLNVNNDKVLPAGTQFTIIEYPDGNGAGELFRRPGDPGNALPDGDLITSGLNTYRINYNPASITLTVADKIDTDNDGIEDHVDNCPLTPNPKQKDMDFDGIGNQCDPDTDGDGFPNVVDEENFPGKPADPDDDNDGVLDVDENDGGDAPFNSRDSDRDDDGIVDELDRDPDDPSNAFTGCVSPDATLAMSVLNTMTCAASNSITTLGPIGISGEDDADGPGDLLMISPKVEFAPGFLVEANGRLSVVSADPTAQISNPEVSCNIYTSTDVPKLISENGKRTVTSELDVSDSFTITDVNVLNLNGEHDIFNQLDFNLTSPNGTDVQLMNNSCPALIEHVDFGLNLDDETVPGDWPCPPVGGGTYKPTQVLSTFDGENSNGTWTLTVNDNLNFWGGSLDGWSLQLCFNPQP